jgi:hypothetical protein
MLLGYCRTSTAEQNPEHQIDALLRNGVDRDSIHVDVGDTLKVARLDQLGFTVALFVTDLASAIRPGPGRPRSVFWPQRCSAPPQPPWSSLPKAPHDQADRTGCG